MVDMRTELYKGSVTEYLGYFSIFPLYSWPDLHLILMGLSVNVGWMSRWWYTKP